jgi:ribose 5-phosphate isomerase B
MRIAFANDHAAFEAHKPLATFLKEQGHELLDFGVDTAESVDYPDQAEKAARAVASGQADIAVLACGTGIGISIAANKIAGIRCALCTDINGAEMARRHNNANAIALRGRGKPVDDNIAILKTFLDAEFEDGRHQRRIDKITALQNK